MFTIIRHYIRLFVLLTLGYIINIDPESDQLVEVGDQFLLEMHRKKCKTYRIVFDFLQAGLIPLSW